jgi:hypothetical protein
MQPFRHSKLIEKLGSEARILESVVGEREKGDVR